MNGVANEPEVLVQAQEDDDALGVRYLCDWVAHQERFDRDRRLERESFTFRSEGETLDELYHNLAQDRCHELPFWGNTVRLEYGPVRKVVVDEVIDIDVSRMQDTGMWRRFSAKQKRIRDEAAARDAAQKERERQSEIDTMRRLMEKHGQSA